MYELETIVPKYSDSDINDLDNEDKLVEASVELLKQTIHLLWIITGLRYCNEEGNSNRISKDEAVVGGNLVRLIKLTTSFLENICNGKSEIAFIINRCIAETFINLKYMLIEGEERVKRNYIKHSLITEKDLWNTIKENVSKRNGDTLPIEERMKRSIEKSFDSSDFDIDEVNSSSKWKSISSRAEKVASTEFYDIFYGLASHSVHGNWQDILFNHLKRKEDQFLLNLTYIRPRPQILDGAIILNLRITEIFTKTELVNSKLKDSIIDKCVLLSKYHEKLVTRHESTME